MTKSLATLVVESRRLKILQTLQNSVGYTADLDLLCDYLVVGAIHLIEDAGWLEDNGLVEMNINEGVTSLRITRQGKDIAMGRCQIIGVRRPEP